MTDPVPGHERQVGKIAIPYLGPNGEPLSMRFRCFQNHDHRELSHGKYMSLKDEPVRPFHVGAIKRARTDIHVAEGEFDAMILNQIGLPAIAIPGVESWRPSFRVMLAGFQRIFVWGDPDEAGAEFNRKLTQLMGRAKAIRLRHGDVTDTYKAIGAEGLRALVPQESK